MIYSQIKPHVLGDVHNVNCKKFGCIKCFNKRYWFRSLVQTPSIGHTKGNKGQRVSLQALRNRLSIHRYMLIYCYFGYCCPFLAGISCVNFTNKIHVSVSPEPGSQTMSWEVSHSRRSAFKALGMYSISQEICTRFCCALLCCGYAIVHNEFTWSVYPYSSGLLCWHWGNR